MTSLEECDVIYTSPAVAELAEKAKELGLQFKIGGMPFGAAYKTHRETLGLPMPERSEMSSGSTQS